RGGSTLRAHVRFAMLPMHGRACCLTSSCGDVSEEARSAAVFGSGVLEGAGVGTLPPTPSSFLADVVPVSPGLPFVIGLLAFARLALDLVARWRLASLNTKAIKLGLLWWRPWMSSKKTVADRAEQAQ